jgi:hypothetical protein
LIHRACIWIKSIFYWRKKKHWCFFFRTMLFVRRKHIVDLVYKLMKKKTCQVEKQEKLRFWNLPHGLVRQEIADNLKIVASSLTTPYFVFFFFLRKPYFGFLGKETFVVQYSISKSLTPIQRRFISKANSILWMEFNYF